MKDVETDFGGAGKLSEKDRGRIGRRRGRAGLLFHIPGGLTALRPKTIFRGVRKKDVGMEKKEAQQEAETIPAAYEPSDKTNKFLEDRPQWISGQKERSFILL